MYELFEYDVSSVGAVTASPWWQYARTRIQEDVTRYKDFYHKRVIRTLSTHPLVQLINAIIADMDFETLTPEQLVDIVEIRGYQKASALRMTTPISFGRPLSKNICYGSEVNELAVGCLNEPFAVATAVSNWRTLAPVKVMYHSMNSLRLPILDGMHSGQETGVATISINIPMLILQYYCWFKDNQANDDIKLEVTHFLKQYPLTNAIDSHMDYVIWNRTMSKFLNKPLSPFSNPHPFVTIDYSRLVDTGLNVICNSAIKRAMRYFMLLHNVPAFSTTNQWAVQEVRQYERNQRVPTQIRWFLIISRMLVVRDMLDWANEVKGAMDVNRADNNYIRRDIDRMYSDKSTFQAMGVDFFIYMYSVFLPGIKAKLS